MELCSTADSLEARAFDDSTPYSLPSEDHCLPATSSMSTLPTEPSPRNAAENQNNLNQSTKVVNNDDMHDCEPW